MAGKTGTTQNHSDGWFIGYTPNIVAGVWVGGASPKVRFRSLNLGAGGNMALPIWGKFMQKAIKDKSFASWQTETFPVLPDSIAALMNCEHYHEEMPVFVDLEEAEDSLEKSDLEKRLEDFFDNVFERKNSKTPTSRDKISQKSKNSRTKSRRSEEIRKRNEKIKRQKKKKEKLKNFFKKIFGNK